MTPSYTGSDPDTDSVDGLPYVSIAGLGPMTPAHTGADSGTESVGVHTVVCTRADPEADPFVLRLLEVRAVGVGCSKAPVHMEPVAKLAQVLAGPISGPNRRNSVAPDAFAHTKADPVDKLAEGGPKPRDSVAPVVGECELLVKHVQALPVGEEP